MADRLLEGRRIVVTGAGRGLGVVYARQAAALGASVVVNDIDAAAVEATAAGIVASGGRAVAIAADVTDWDAAGAIVETCVRELGGIDGLINNAGVLGYVRPIHEEQANARRGIEINVVGVLNMAAHVTRTMVAAGSRGAIVNASSGAQMGLLHQGTYSAAKAAVATYTYSWSRDLAEHGIRVNAINPNAITPMLDDLIDQVGHNPESHNAVYPEPEHNGALVMWLLSDASAHVNGQVVRVEAGGLTMMSHPLIMNPRAPVAAWTPEGVGEAFASVLDDLIQPVGVARGDVRAGEVIF